MSSFVEEEGFIKIETFEIRFYLARAINLSESEKSNKIVHNKIFFVSAFKVSRPHSSVTERLVFECKVLQTLQAWRTGQRNYLRLTNSKWFRFEFRILSHLWWTPIFMELNICHECHQCTPCWNVHRPKFLTTINGWWSFHAKSEVSSAPETDTCEDIGLRPQDRVGQLLGRSSMGTFELALTTFTRLGQK